MGHSPCEFMHDLYIGKTYGPGSMFLPLIVSLYTTSYHRVKWCITVIQVIQGHGNWYQSKLRATSY